MIKIEKSDNLLDIIKKIKKEESKKIILNFPLGHQVLYNKFALRAIKESVKNKKIIFETNDILSKKIGKKLGIKYKFSNIKSEKNLLKLNYNFLEYFLFEVKSFFSFFNKKQKYKDPRKKYSKFYKNNFKIFIILLIFTLFIFFYLFLFIFNKTFVYITPNIEVKNKNLNFYLSTNNDPNTIKLTKISKTIFLEKNIEASGFEIAKQNKARGKVELINKLQEVIKLKAHTRLQTKNGLLFEIENSINIPKAIKNKSSILIPGRITTKIIAKNKDIKGNPIGLSGNIQKNTKLILPGLSKDLQDDIYAKSIENFIGGKNKFKKIVTKEDIENAKKIFEEQLKKEAIYKVKKEIEKMSLEKNIKYKIPNINNIFSFSNLEINLGDVKAGEQKDKFKISGKIQVTTYVFNSTKVISKLKNEIEQHLLDGKEKLIDIDEKSLSSENKVGIIKRTNNPFSLKITLGVNYYIKYNFGDNKDNYIKRLKQSISGIDKEKAEKLLINEEKISNAKIKIRPFFMDKVSKYPNNINFIISE